MTRSLTLEEIHVLLDVITQYRENPTGEPWKGYDNPEEIDPLGDETGWNELLDSADITLSDMLDEAS